MAAFWRLMLFFGGSALTSAAPGDSRTVEPLPEIPAPAVAVVRGASGAPGDVTREGAGEFAVMLQIARLRHIHETVGVVSIGDHNGVLRSGGERALRRAALSGVVVVKLAPGGRLAADEDEVFLDGGPLSEAASQALLAECLRRLGPPPRVADLDAPTVAECAAIRRHLDGYRAAFRAAMTATSETQGS